MKLLTKFDKFSSYLTCLENKVSESVTFRLKDQFSIIALLSRGALQCGSGESHRPCDPLIPVAPLF